MNGKRKLFVVVLYIFAVTSVALSVVFMKYDSLIGVGTFATGLATGVGAFMWGNAREHAAKAKQQ